MIQVLDLVLKLVTLASVLIGAVAIYTAIRNNNRQMGAQIFLEYSDRIRAVRRGWADGVIDPGAGHGADPQAVRETIGLIFEFFSLRRRGYVDNSIWSIWESDIAYLLNTQPFLSEWPIMEQRFVHHQDFVRWVARQHGKQERKKRVWE